MPDDAAEPWWKDRARRAPSEYRAGWRKGHVSGRTLERLRIEREWQRLPLGRRLRAAWWGRLP